FIPATRVPMPARCSSAFPKAKDRGFPFAHGSPARPDYGRRNLLTTSVRRRDRPADLFVALPGTWPQVCFGIALADGVGAQEAPAGAGLFAIDCLFTI